MNELQPDLLTVQELIELPTAQMFLDSVMLPTSPVYNLATYFSYDTDRGLYYNSEQFNFWMRRRSMSGCVISTSFICDIPRADRSSTFFTLHLKATSG